MFASTRLPYLKAGRRIPEYYFLTQGFGPKAWLLDIHVSDIAFRQLVEWLQQRGEPYDFEVRPGRYPEWVCIRLRFPYAKLRRWHYRNRDTRFLTLSAALAYLSCAKDSTDGFSQRDQLLALQTFVPPDDDFHLGGQALNLEATPQTAELIAHLARDPAAEHRYAEAGTSAMLSLLGHTFGKRLARGYTDGWMLYGRLTETGTLSFLTLGNCACLGCEPRRDPHEGFAASSHNVDSWMQQLQIVAGIVAIWELLRQEPALFPA